MFLKFNVKYKKHNLSQYMKLGFLLYFLIYIENIFLIMVIGKYFSKNKCLNICIF